MKTWITLNLNKHPQKLGFKYSRQYGAKWLVLNTEHNRSVCKEVFPNVDDAYLLEKGYLEPKLDQLANLASLKNLTSFEPFNHQKEALQYANERKFFAYLMEQGTGKTKTSLDEFALLNAKGKATSKLIICPNIAREVWRKEIINHLGVDSHKVYTYHEMPKNTDESEYNVFIINYESILPGTKGRKVLDRWVMYQDTIFMTLDESHYIKSIKSKQTKAAIELAEEAEYIRLLSGTPIGNSNEDIFSQFYCMSSDIFEGMNVFSFRDRYLVMGGYGGHSVIGHKNEEEIQEIIKMHSYVVRKKDCLDLPEKIFQQLAIPLSPKSKKVYKAKIEDIKKQYATIQGKTQQPQILAISNKLRQLASGIIKTDSGYEVVFEDKLDYTISFIKDLEVDKVLIWCEYRGEIAELSKRLNNIYPNQVLTLHGDNSKDRNSILHKFENSHKFLIVQTQTAKEAVTMNWVHTVINFSNSFSSIDRKQKEDRCHRIGQKHNVSYYDTLVQNTADERIYNSLIKKTKFAEKQLIQELL